MTRPPTGIALEQFTDEPLKSAFIEAALEVKQIFLCSFDPASIVFRPDTSVIAFDVTLLNGWEKELFVRYEKIVGKDAAELKHTLISRISHAIEESVRQRQPRTPAAASASPRHQSSVNVSSEREDRQQW